MGRRRAILKRLERGLLRDIKRTTKRLEVVRKLIALDESDGALRIAAVSSGSEDLIEAACGLIEAHGGEMHIRELEAQLAALAGEERIVNLHAQIRRHPERIAPRENGFLALTAARTRKRRGRKADVPTLPLRPSPRSREDATNRASIARQPTSASRGAKHDSTFDTKDS